METSNGGVDGVSDVVSCGLSDWASLMTPDGASFSFVVVIDVRVVVVVI